MKLRHPKGDYTIKDVNNWKWRDVLAMFCVDKATIKIINGNRYVYGSILGRMSTDEYIPVSELEAF